MRLPISIRILALGVVLCCAALPSTAQVVNPTAKTVDVSPKKAFLYSLILPGLGHKYAHGGSWGRSGASLALLDGAMWVGVISAGWQEDQRIESYRTLAVTGAGAAIDGKNRTFFLRMASFRSSEEFVDVSLRNRAWNDIDYVSDPAFQWDWESEEDYLRYRELREQAESLGRRQKVLTATIVANRLISGLLAARSARRAVASSFAVGVGSPDAGRSVSVNLAVRF